MLSSDDPRALLLHEWSICDAGLARYDTLAFNIRTWAITIYGAALAASLALEKDWYIPIIVLVMIASCWWTDGVYRTLQHQYLVRTTEIQTELKISMLTTDPSAYLHQFMIERPWIGPIFASVDKNTRDWIAIAHMAWQPHIRWFYLPLFVIALFGSCIAAADSIARRWGYGPELLIGSVILLSAVAWIAIRKIRKIVGAREEQTSRDIKTLRKDRCLRAGGAEAACEQAS